MLILCGCSTDSLRHCTAGILAQATLQCRPQVYRDYRERLVQIYQQPFEELSSVGAIPLDIEAVPTSLPSRIAD